MRFQPTKRPQLPQKHKAKISFPKPPPPPDNSNQNSAPTTSASNTARPPIKSTLADWTATADDDDVNGFYGGEKRQRGGRKRRKKNREEHVVAQDWDDIYDPTRPNNYEEYRLSEEKIREVREWKDRLYAHRKARRASSDMDSDEEDRSKSLEIHALWSMLMDCRPIRATFELLLRTSTYRLSTQKTSSRREQ